MERVCVFIDGFNLYHGIKKYNTPRYKWLNLRKMSRQYINERTQKIEDIFYFSAYCTWNTSSTVRHKKYIEALKTEKVHIILGKYNKVSRTFTNSMPLLKCLPKDKIPKYLKYNTHEEKKTDVNIALKIFEYAFLDKYDTAIIISGDSDIIPAIELAKKYFGKKFISVLPPHTKGNEIQTTCNMNAKIKEKMLKHCIFPNIITAKNGEIIKIPEEYL